MRKYLFILSIINLLAFGKVIAQNETIQWSVISSGGTITISQNNVIESVAGQPIVDKTSFGSDEILVGFFANPDAQPASVTSVDETKPVVIYNYNLFQNYPNPFNPSTKIGWQTPVSGHQSLKIYDVLGKEVATLIDGYKEAGKYEVSFDASKLASGIYFYRLQSGNFVETKKMILMK